MSKLAKLQLLDKHLLINAIGFMATTFVTTKQLQNDRVEKIRDRLNMKSTPKSQVENTFIVCKPSKPTTMSSWALLEMIVIKEC